MTAPDATEAARLRRAMASMAATFTDIATDIAARHDERCPYRSAQELCTFGGGCQNQRRDRPDDAAAIACGGDSRLRWTSSSAVGSGFSRTGRRVRHIITS